MVAERRIRVADGDRAVVDQSIWIGVGYADRAIQSAVVGDVNGSAGREGRNAGAQRTCLDRTVVDHRGSAGEHQRRTAVTSADQTVVDDAVTVLSE